MESKSLLGKNMSKLFFLEVKKERLQHIVKLKENIYMPIKSEDIINKVKKNSNVEEISFNHFVEGMFYVLGIDKNFKYNEQYKEIILNIKESTSFIKGKIFRELESEDFDKKTNFEDAYILLKGLLEIESNEDNFEKTLSLVDVLRRENSAFKDEELEVIEKAKEANNENPVPWLYEAMVKKDDQDFQKSYFCLNTYVSMGGNVSSEIDLIKSSVKNAYDYDQGKLLLYEVPSEALKYLLPLLEQFSDDSSLYYYVAVAYRNLKDHETAIFYLEQALTLDNGFIDVVNELGINYASLDNIEKAILYFRKAFEATRSVEICSNLVMCYINIGDVEQAKLHLEIAKKLDPKDEIVLEIEKSMKKLK